MTRTAFLPHWLMALGFFGFVSASQATLISSWTEDQGTATISGQNTTSVTVGDGSINNASGVSVSGSISGTVTTSTIGSQVVISGTLSLTGVSNGSAEGGLSFGLYNTNGSSNANGWLGYSVSNSDGTKTGQLMERDTGNTTIYSSTTGETQLATTLATSSPSITDGTYSFNLTLTLQPGNAYAIAYALNRTSSAGYSMAGTFTDSTPNTFSFNRVGFFASSTLKADQFVISLTDVSISVIPEPTCGDLLTLGTLFFGTVRKRRTLRAS